MEPEYRSPNRFNVNVGDVYLRKSNGKMVSFEVKGVYEGSFFAKRKLNGLISGVGVAHVPYEDAVILSNQRGGGVKERLMVAESKLEQVPEVLDFLKGRGKMRNK